MKNSETSSLGLCVIGSVTVSSQEGSAAETPGFVGYVRNFVFVALTSMEHIIFFRSLPIQRFLFVLRDSPQALKLTLAVHLPMIILPRPYGSLQTRTSHSSRFHDSR